MRYLFKTELAAKLLINIKFGETTNKNIGNFPIFEGTAPPRSYGIVRLKKKETSVVLRGIKMRLEKI